MGRPPSDFAGFVGNRRAVDLLQQYVRGTRESGRVFPNILLAGAPGMGKSTLASALAKQLGTTLHRINGAARPDPLTVLKVLTKIEHGDVMALDEAHMTPRPVQDLLLAALGESRLIPKLLEQEGHVSVSSTETASIPNFSAVLATDQPGRLLPALRSRVPLILELEPYDLRDLREICRRLCAQEGVPISGQGITLLAQAARGTPRRAVQLVELLRHFYPPPRELSVADVKEFLDKHGIDGHMLGPLERSYLLLLHRQTRPTSVRFLCRLLGVDATYMADSVECTLRRDGLIEVSASGRELTRAGRQLADELAAAVEEVPEAADED